MCDLCDKCLLKDTFFCCYWGGYTLGVFLKLTTDAERKGVRQLVLIFYIDVREFNKEEEEKSYVPNTEEDKPSASSTNAEFLRLTSVAGCICWVINIQ